MNAPERIERIGLGYERAAERAADRYWNVKPTCPWCECYSDDEDTCSECGEDMTGEGYWACPYCGNEMEEHGMCCSEKHAEWREPK